MACALGIEQDCNESRMCGNGKSGKNMTNFERIKGMSVEEFAELLLKVNTSYSEPCMTGEKITSGKTTQRMTRVARIVLRDGWKASVIRKETIMSNVYQYISFPRMLYGKFDGLRKADYELCKLQ